ncbi:DNA polymerase III subunit gamma/tau [Pseudorhodoferax sp.]|uniref:DNA polymerase III subunit gamma/tau n=1 Tax=Pseudorhodoferax sp. TaxID=1993553 RepID=UPI002DD63503|nr:DNA polymerase III subunit gamma/tau [Pseudorhodoferax sp.]
MSSQAHPVHPTHQALARSYRPRQFAGLVGQEHVTQALGNALRTGRLHHAYLFTGTRGVGKTTVSRILAKALNCVGLDGQGGVTAEPCGVCPACRDIDAGRFVDYVELDAASNRGVEEISQLLDQAVYKPVVGRTKVYLIDEVHMLSTHAFNAMLKTLEEPPDYLKFVLATTDPQKVPVTVLSRCLQFNLRPLPPPLIAEHLTAVLRQEGMDCEEGALRLIARAARGSMRDALSLTDQAIAFGAGRLQEDQVQQMLGATPRAHVLNLLRQLAEGDGAALVAEVDALRAAGHAAQGVADELARWLQLIALAQAAPQALDPQDPDSQDVQPLAALWPADELHLGYRILLQAREELPLSPDEHAGLLMLLLRALAFRPAGRTSAPATSAALRVPAAPRLSVPVPRGGPEVEVASRPVEPVQPVQPVPPVPPLRPLAPRTRPPVSVPVAPPEPAPAPAEPSALASTAPVPAPGAEAEDGAPPWLDLPPQEADAGAESVPPESAPLPVAAAAEASPALQSTPLGAEWAELVPRLEMVGLARTLALQSQCLQLERGGGAWSVRLRSPSAALQAGQARLEAALLKHAGVSVRLQLEAGEVQDSPLLREQAAAQQRQRGAEAEIAGSAELALIQEHFPGARVLPGSIKPLESPP